MIAEDVEYHKTHLIMKGFDILEYEPTEQLLKDAYRKFLTDRGTFFKRPKPTRPQSRNWKYGYDILPEERDAIKHS